MSIDVKEYLSDIGHLVNFNTMPDINADFDRFSRQHSWYKHNSDCDIAYLFLTVGEQARNPISPDVIDPVGLHWAFLFERDLDNINPQLVPIDFIKRFPVYLNRELEGGRTWLFQKMICEKAAKNFWNEIVYYASSMTFAPDDVFEQRKIYYNTIGDFKLVTRYDGKLTWFVKLDKEDNEYQLTKEDTNVPLYPLIKKLELIVPTDTRMVEILTVGEGDKYITYGEFVTAVENHYSSLKGWTLYGYTGILYKGKKFYM